MKFTIKELKNNVTSTSYGVNRLIVFILEKNIEYLEIPENELTINFTLIISEFLNYKDKFKTKKINVKELIDSYSDDEILQSFLNGYLLPLQKTFSDAEIYYLIKVFGIFKYDRTNEELIDIVLNKLPRIKEIFKNNYEVFLKILLSKLF
ncbi:MAG: hypothetical protein QXW35_05115 [Candidatus Aenigmatarchaeota archaeon]